MADYAECGANPYMAQRRRKGKTEKPDAPVFIATGMGYAANLAALALLARRFFRDEATDGASAWGFIAVSCIAAALVCAVILRVRAGRRPF